MEIDDSYLSDYNISHEKLYAELKRTEAENYHLKRQLKNLRIADRGRLKYIKKLEKKIKSYDKPEQHYRNGRKRGSNGFNG